MAGILCLNRDRIFDGPFAQEERVYSRFEAYLDLCQRAAHSPHTQLLRGKLMHLKIGEQTASERFLEKRWNWSRTKVRSFLSMLRKNHELDHREDQGETVIILCRYKEITAPPSKKEPPNIPPKIPEENQQRTTEEPKEKEGKERESLSPPEASASEYSDKMPTSAANRMQEFERRIQGLKPDWKTAFTYHEMELLRHNARALDSLSDEDWTTLRDYLWARIPRGEPDERPRFRSKLLEWLPDVVARALEWKRKQVKKTVLRRNPSAPKQGQPMDREEVAAILNPGGKSQ